MGVGDLFTILAGGAWLTKEAVNEIGERADDQTRDALIKKYIAEHTDPALERRLWEDVENPVMYDELWRRIETFKRDNPVYCNEDIIKNTKKDYTGIKEIVYSPWYDVGKRRPLFRDANPSGLVYLLMQTYGKMKLSHAREEAERLYPIPKSKRSW